MTRLRRRVPRPPPIFVGRATELAWLDAAFERGPVVTIGGWAGIGKTALLSTWCQRFPAEDVVCVTAESLRSLYEQLCMHWSEPAEPCDAEGCAFAVITGMERRREHVVIEDGHRFSAADELAGLVSKFAKWSSGSSRLIVLGRTRLVAPEVAEQSMWLGPLDDEHVGALLTQCGARVDDVPAMVRRARGSPLEARRLASGHPERSAALLSDLSSDSLTLLALLSHVGPLPELALPDPLRRASDHLGSLQLVEREAGILQLVEANRSVLGDLPGPEPAAAAETAVGLIELGMSAWRWQALLLSRLASRDDIASRCLLEVDEAFVGMVGPQRLFELIFDLQSNEALRAMLLCIVSAPWPRGLSWLAELPTPADPTLKLAYADALFAANQGAQANQVFREVALSPGPAELRLEALIGLARGTGELAVGEIAHQLTQLDLSVESDRLRRDVWLSLARYRGGARFEAQTLARSVFARRHLLSRNRATSCRDLFYVTIHVAMFNEARRLAEEESYGRPHSPRWLYYAAVLAVETCDEDQRRWALGRLEQVAAGSMRYRFLVAFLNERWAEHVNLGRALNEAQEMWSIARAVQDPLFLTDCRMYQLELSLYSATRPPDALLVNDGTHAELVSLIRLRMTGEDSGPPARVGDGPWHAILEAERMGAAGRATDADALLEGWIADAQRRVAVLEEADLRVAQAHMLLRAGDRRGARAHAIREQLLAFATAHKLDEVRRLAVGMQLLLSERRPADPALLESSEGHGLSARIIRALLGEQALEWASDQQTLACVLRRWASADGMELHLDSELCTVTTTGGHTLSLGSHRLLYRVVEILVSSRPKGATKERLAREVWSLPTYRASRDDKRVQVAIARLRSLIAKAGFPIGIATTPTGYALANESP